MLRQLKKYREHLLVLILIVSSGNPLFVLSPHVRELYIGTVFLLLWLKQRRVMSLYIKYSVPFIFISLFQMLLFPDYSISSGVYLLLKIFIGALIMMEVGRKFAKIYVDIMVVVATISIPFFSIMNMLVSFLVSRLPILEHHWLYIHNYFRIMEGLSIEMQVCFGNLVLIKVI